MHDFFTVAKDIVCGRLSGMTYTVPKCLVRDMYKRLQTFTSTEKLKPFFSLVTKDISNSRDTKFFQAFCSVYS